MEVAESTRNKRPKVWEYFVCDTSRKSVICKLCKLSLAYHGSTSAMHEHLKRKHLHVVEDSDSPRAKKSTGAMDGFLQKKQACTPQQATALTESILNMMVKDMRPLSIVDGEGFQQMIHQFNPDYTLPSRTYFTNKMEKKYEGAFTKGEFELNSESVKDIVQRSEAS